MNQKQENTNQNKYKTNLMKEILNVRYTDLEQEVILCKHLLSLAEADRDNYGCAFANVYLLDAYLALGDYSSCDFYLIRAGFLCREHGYDDLTRMLCNFAGLYYLKLGDEQSALEYYLEGLKIVRRMKDYTTESKLLNNIGIGFGGRGDWVSAKDYFSQAFNVIEPHLEEEDSGNAISYLSNLSEACQNLGDIQGSEEALTKCQRIGNLSLYQQLRLACGWATHFAMQKDWENWRAMTNRVLELGLLEFKQKYFVYDMCVGLCEQMFVAEDKEGIEEFLRILEGLSKQAALTNRYRLQCLKIEYCEKYGVEEMLERAYQEYFEVLVQMTGIEGKARAQSMTSKIQLTRVTIEREEMRKKNEELEFVGQLDDLTGLYNRRYFNKLAAKIKYDPWIQTVGLVMVDVDYFKQYNDHYGHFLGDDALKAVARILKKFASENIHVSRYGGDEFICLCVDMKDEEIEAYVQQVYRGVQEEKIQHGKSKVSDYLSLSLGYCNESVCVGMERLILLADQALYRAKGAGRNTFTRKKIEEDA